MVAGVEEGTVIANVCVEEPNKLRLITGVLGAESLVLLLLCFLIAFAPFSETKLSIAQRVSRFRGGVLGFRPGRATLCLAVQLGGGPQGRTLLQLKAAKIRGPWGKNEEQFVGDEILVTEIQGENVIGLETKQRRKEESTKPREPEERSHVNKIRKRMQKKEGIPIIIIL